ncbi:MAG: response regulator [Methyloversatilis sp.]|nr:response regulator [Methyloversatilis sp.]
MDDALTPGGGRLLQRIAGLFALVFCISVVGNALYTAYEQSQHTLEQLHRNALAETRVIGERIHQATRLDQDNLRRLLPGDTRLQGTALIGKDGTTLAAFRHDAGPGWVQTAPIQFEAPPATRQPEVRTLSVSGSRTGAGRQTRVVSWVPLAGEGGLRWLRTETDNAEAHEVWEHILADSLLHGLIAMLIGIVALYALLRRPLAALQQCTDFAERLDRSTGETLPTGTGSRETDRLAQALNWASLSLYDQRSALAESEAHTGAIMSAAIDAVITFDTFGNVIEYNPAAERMFGWTAAAAMQRPVIELLVKRSQRDRDETDLLQWLGRRFDAVIGHHLQIDLCRRDGSQFPAELAITATQMKGRTLYTAFVCDISERKAIQEQIMHARDAAEAANRAKSDFLANMSHEIRTPMNAIMGMTELALDTDLTAEQREYLGLVKQSSDALLTLIDDILDFSKIEAGHLDFEHIPFSLRDVIGGVVRTLRPKAGKPVELRCHIDPAVADAVLGDPMRLRQVLTNLLSNALKFTERGHVEVSVTLDELTPDAQGLRFAVRDTGIGIPLDKQTLIFDVFSQADTSTTRRFGGTGLGLAICTRLVQCMDGMISVTSTPGEGSTFHFTVRFPRAVGSELAQSDTRSLDNMAVLVIEPDAAARDDLATRLAHWHVVPKLCADLDAGIGAIVSAETEARCFQALLVDLDIARRDEWALVHTLGSEYSPDLPIIVLHDGTAPEAKTVPAGVSGLIARPVQSAQLLDALMAALGMHPDASAGSPSDTQSPLRDNRPLNILLAEDNPINQTLALRLLERLGHHVELASNGIEAVALAARQRFDVILMDVQMPQMGGFEATRRIRAQDGQRHTPIVAMTAHAMAGDREKCIEAGMDGYVSKPVQVPALLRALDEALGPSVAPPVSRPPDTPAVEARFDRQFMLGNLGGDEVLMHDIITLFLRDYRSTLDALVQAFAGGTREELATQAHTLKGIVRNFGASRGAGIAAQLERGGGGTPTEDPQCAAWVEQLVDETEALVTELRAAQQAARKVA